MVRVIGYARVSADDPNVSLQFDALKQVGGPDRQILVQGHGGRLALSENVAPWRAMSSQWNTRGEAATSSLDT